MKALTIKQPWAWAIVGKFKNRVAATRLKLRITDGEMHKLLHALGLDENNKSYRNYYSPGMPSDFNNLVALGVFYSNMEDAEYIGKQTFHVTDSAIEQLKALGWEFAP